MTPMVTTTSHASARGTRLTVAEGGIALTCCYGILGAAIGAAAGAFMLGLLVGLGVGLLAVISILVISGASLASRGSRPGARSSARAYDPSRGPAGRIPQPTVQR